MVVSSASHYPFEFFKGAGLLLAVGDRNAHNAMTIGWGGLGNIWGNRRNTMTVYVAPARFTHGFMEKAEYFTVMAFDDAEVLSYMGRLSGRDGDKAAALGLHTLYTDNGTPYYEEATTVYECKMLYRAPLDPKGMSETASQWYKNSTSGIHSMYIGEIVRVMKKK